MAAYTHWRLGNLKSPFAPDKIGLMLCAGAGAAAGATSMSGASTAMALALIVVAQSFLGWSMLRRGRVQSTPANSFNARSPASRLYFSLVGMLTSIGAGGGLIVPYLYGKGVSHREAVALACWLGLLIGASALGVYATRATSAMSWVLGVVHLPAVLLIASGSLLGVRLGAVLAARIDQEWFRRGLAVFLIVSCGRSASHLLS